MIIAARKWKNKGGTSQRSCSCGSWKQHWMKFSGQTWPNECSILDCHQKATLGAHIYCTNSGSHDEYIVPACDSCNKLTEEFCLKKSVTLVPASKQKTCDKP